MTIYDKSNPFDGKVLLISGGSAIWECGLYDTILEELDKLGAEIFELFDVELDLPHVAVERGAALCEEEGIKVLLSVGSDAANTAAIGIAAALRLDEDKVWNLARIQEEVLRTVVHGAPAILRRTDAFEAKAALNWAESWVSCVFPFDGVFQEMASCTEDPELLEFGGFGLKQNWLSFALNQETAPEIQRRGVSALGVDETLPVMEGAKAAISAFSEFLYETLVLGSDVSDLMLEDVGYTAMAV